MNESANELGIILKQKQTDAILSFASGKDTFVSLPTGYYNSVIFDFAFCGG